MSNAAPLSITRAVALGVLQGPAELLPISSSAHLSLLAWREEGDPEGDLRNALAVALHAGTGLALVIAWRRQLADELARLDGARARMIGLSAIAPAICGYAFHDVVADRLGTSGTIAAGLIAGAAAMAWADRAPELRGHRSATALDGWWLGLAQAAALIPGVSRSGATLAAARARRFRRRDADHLSRLVALPVLAGAAALESAQLVRRGQGPRTAAPLAAGAAAAFASSLASLRLTARAPATRSLRPYAIYRLCLAALILVTRGSTACPWR